MSFVVYNEIAMTQLRYSAPLEPRMRFVAALPGILPSAAA